MSKVKVPQSPEVAAAEEIQSELIRNGFFSSSCGAHDFACIIARHCRSAVKDAALEAHLAWSYAEEQPMPKSSTWEERMDLCKYAEWATLEALGYNPEKFVGVPHFQMIVWPCCDVKRVSEETIKTVVQRLVAEARAALGPAEGEE